jgi:hypothetical protein
VQRHDLGDRLVETAEVLLGRDARRDPAGRSRSAVSVGVGCSPQRFAVTGVEVDLDRPAELGNGEVEPGFAVIRELDAVLANEPAHSRMPQSVGDPDLGM